MITGNVPTERNLEMPDVQLFLYNNRATGTAFNELCRSLREVTAHALSGIDDEGSDLVIFPDQIDLHVVRFGPGGSYHLDTSCVALVKIEGYGFAERLATLEDRLKRISDCVADHMRTGDKVSTSFTIVPRGGWVSSTKE